MEGRSTAKMKKSHREFREQKAAFRKEMLDMLESLGLHEFEEGKEVFHDKKCWKRRIEPGIDVVVNEFGDHFDLWIWIDRKRTVCLKLNCSPMDVGYVVWHKSGD